MALDPLVLLIILLTLSVVIAFGIGANDEAMAPIVGSGAMKLKWVLLMGFGINIVGAVFLGGAVSETIGVGLLDIGVVGPKIENLILAVIISTSFFLILSSLKGLPVSTTVSVVGSVIGVGIYYMISYGADVVLWGGFTSVILGWVISPIMGLLVSMGIYLVLRKYVLTIPKGLRGIERMEK